MLGPASTFLRVAKGRGRQGSRQLGAAPFPGATETSPELYSLVLLCQGRCLLWEKFVFELSWAASFGGEECGLLILITTQDRDPRLYAL